MEYFLKYSFSQGLLMSTIDIILCLSSFLELLTPCFPSMFILLGALANIGMISVYY